MKGRPTHEELRRRNLALAATAGLSGCATLVIVMAALLIGLWLDAQFDRPGLFVFGLLILSVPLSLYTMLRITLAAVARIIPQDPPQATRASKVRPLPVETAQPTEPEESEEG